MDFSKLRPKRKSDWVILILLGVLIMIVALPTGSSSKNTQGGGAQNGTVQGGGAQNGGIVQNNGSAQNGAGQGGAAQDGGAVQNNGSALNREAVQGTSASSGFWESMTAEEYIEYLEQKLSDTLTQMQGVGQVQVMITLRDEGEAVVNKDVTKDEKQYEESTTLIEQDSGTGPYVTSRRFPSVEGVVVVAEGAGQAGIRAEITETVMALFPVEVHKVKVLARG